MISGRLGKRVPRRRKEGKEEGEGGHWAGAGETLLKRQQEKSLSAVNS